MRLGGARRLQFVVATALSRRVTASAILRIELRVGAQSEAATIVATAPNHPSPYPLPEGEEDASVPGEGFREIIDRRAKPRCISVLLRTWYRR